MCVKVRCPSQLKLGPRKSRKTAKSVFFFYYYYFLFFWSPSSTTAKNRATLTRKREKKRKKEKPKLNFLLTEINPKKKKKKKKETSSFLSLFDAITLTDAILFLFYYFLFPPSSGFPLFLVSFSSAVDHAIADT